VNIARLALDEIVAHARRSVPLECCGLLIGDRLRIVAARPAVNLAASPTRYELDPRAHIEARREARADGLEVVGFYHSHPLGPARPSPTDIAEASYPEAIWIVVGLQEPIEARAFTLDARGATEIALYTED
jgi:proteasome lid subunit RPN8/RPN11